MQTDARYVHSPTKHLGLGLQDCLHLPAAGGRLAIRATQEACCCTMAPGQIRTAVRGARRSLKAAGRTLAAAQAAGGAQPASPGSTAIYQRLVSGKRFKCTQCSVCCTGAGDVWVNQADCRRLAAHLSIPEQDVVRLFTEKEQRSGWWTLRSVGEARDCIFLDKDKACSVHGAKPLQCTTYPWWCAAWQHAAVQWGMAGQATAVQATEAPALQAGAHGRRWVAVRAGGHM